MGLAFKLLKKTCKVGDRIVITSSTGTSEGVILDIDDNEIALQLDNGDFLTCHGDDIIAMKTINVTSSEHSQKDVNKESADTTNIVQQPVSETPAEEPLTNEIEEKKDEPTKEGLEDTQEVTDIDEETVHIEDDNPSIIEQDQPKPSKSNSISLDNLLYMKWKDLNWRRQTYTKMLAVFKRLGEYDNFEHNNKRLPIKGKFSPSTEGIIIDSFNGSKYIYTSDELLFPKKMYGSSLYFRKEDRTLIDILPAHKISDIIHLLENLIRKEQLGDNPKLPLKVLKALLNAVPENLMLIQLCNDIETLLYSFGYDAKQARRNYHSTEKKQNPNSAYQIANKLTKEKRHTEALPYYLEAITNSENTISSIHTAASTYLTLYKQAQKSTETGVNREAEELQDAAIKFMQENKDKLPKEDSTVFLLENFYYSIRDYDHFFEILPKVMEVNKVKNNISMLSTYLNKKATALIAIKRYSDAQETISEALNINPDNVGAQRIQGVLDQLIKLNEALEHADEKQAEEIKEELEKISNTDFSAFTDGDLGIFITQTLDEYTEMEGLSEFVKANKDYNKQTLKTIRIRIGDTGKSRPGERAKLILTEVKLMQYLDVEGDHRTIHGEMAQYCQAMAELSLYQNDMDVARFYYDQSFALEQNSDSSTDKYISVYLQTLSYTPKEILNEIYKPTPPIDEMLPHVLTNEITASQWEVLITLLLYNKNVAGKIVPCLYHNEELREQALCTLKRFPIRQPDVNSELEFIKAWDEVRGKRLNDRRRVTNQIRLFGESCSKLEDVSTNMGNALEECREEDWLSALDRQRLGGILDTILSPIRTYLGCRGYLNKLNARNNINSQIRAMQEDIKKRPTKLSFEAILPLLKRVHELVEDAFNTVMLTSKPEITITLPADETVIERGNMVSLQIKVANGKDSSPISNVTVEIKNTNGIFYEKGRTEETGVQIEGGKEHIFKCRIKVNDEVIRNEGASIDIVCHYRDREDKQQRAEDSRPLTLYSRENFSEIINPYKAGDKLSSTDPTFKGRINDINEVVESIKRTGENEPGKQIIIYGQKRCGKSSVLERVKKRLEDAGYFCIEFSLEQLSRTINEFTFYHGILKALSSQLVLLSRHSDNPEIQKRWGSEIPKFEIPRLDDFKKEDSENPVNTFVDYMSKFRTICHNLPQWRNCKIVLMIDEFTAIYAGVESGRIDQSIMKQWKAITQHPDCNFSVVLVGQDVTPSFMNKPYAANAFRIIEGRRLTYLPLNEARELVEEPMTTANGGHSPYIGKSIDRIIEYTSRNPYYIQLMCTKLVQYINEHQLKKVTEADVDDLADAMKYDLDDGTFDNLINAGEEIDTKEYQQKKDEILSVLRSLAKLSKVRGYDYCNNSDIEAIADKERQRDILEELSDREVLEKKEDSYKIQVRLFKEWLLK